MLTSFISQVQANCQAASGAQAGYFSLCGLLLRLRQLYKWQHGLQPWQEPDPEPVLAWIADLETAWDKEEETAPAPLALNGDVFDPFAVEALNEVLSSLNLAYGAGFSRGMVPTFFLGDLTEVRRTGEATVLILGRELARDLDGAPALCQGSLVYARREALAYYLWDRLADPTQAGNRFLKAALDERRLCLEAWWRDPEGHQEHFDALLDGELESVIHHELGEVREASFRKSLHAVLTRFPQTRAEHWVRALKDALAEVNEAGRLAFLIRERRFVSFALFQAWQPGLYPLLLPELEPAFQELTASGAWDAVEEARCSALARLRHTARKLAELLGADLPDHDTARELDRRFLQPIGL